MDLNSIIKALGGKKSDPFEDRWPSQPQDSSGTDAGRNAFRKGFWSADALPADYLPPSPKKALPTSKKPMRWGAGVVEGQPDDSMRGEIDTLREIPIAPGWASKEVDPESVLKPNTQGFDEVLEMLAPKKKLKGPNDHSDLIKETLGIEL